MALNPPQQGYQQQNLQLTNILNRQLRNARRTGDFKGAYEAIQQGRKLGLPIGRRVAIEEVQGTGTQDYNDDMAMAGEIQRRGYNLNPSVPSFAPVPRTGMLQAPGQSDNGIPTPMSLTKPQQQAPVLPSPEGGQTSGGYAATQPQEMPDAGGGYNFAQRKPQSAAEGVEMMGLPTPSVDPYFEQTGRTNPAQMPSTVSPGNPQAAQSAPMSGGYNLAPDRALRRVGANQYRGNQLADAKGNTNSGSIGGYDFSQTRQSPLARGEGFTGRPNPSVGFSRAWQLAKTQEEKDALVARAYKLGVPMNQSAALPSLRRAGLAPSAKPVPGDFSWGRTIAGEVERKRMT